jgi:hypothetical protein
MVHEYRDRVYIRKDVILKLSEYGELNQTKLMSYCGLNVFLAGPERLGRKNFKIETQ